MDKELMKSALDAAQEMTSNLTKLINSDEETVIFSAMALAGLISTVDIYIDKVKTVLKNRKVLDPDPPQEEPKKDGLAENIRNKWNS
jgi:hypothetical protein